MNGYVNGEDANINENEILRKEIEILKVSSYFSNFCHLISFLILSDSLLEAIIYYFNAIGVNLKRVILFLHLKSVYLLKNIENKAAFNHSFFYDILIYLSTPTHPH